MGWVPSSHPSHQCRNGTGREDTNWEGDSIWASLLLTAPFLHHLLSETAGCCRVTLAPDWSSPQDPGTPFIHQLWGQIY